MSGKTRNIAIQRVLQQCQLQCCKISCTFFLARFSLPLCTSLTRFRREASVSIRKKYPLESGVVNSLPLRENSRECFALKPKFSGDPFFINKRCILVALHITTYHYPSLHITVHHYTSLSITTHHFPSLHITLHHYTSLSITRHHYPSLHVTTHHYPSLHIAVHHYLSLSITIHH